MMRSISNPWRLAILLIVPLLFLWLISLREVRLKIGDYYFSKGNFDQAAHWYAKSVNKGKLKKNNKVETITKLKNAYSKSASFHFNRGEKYLSTNRNLAEIEFEKAIHNYEIFSQDIDQFLIQNQSNFARLLHKEFLSLAKKAYLKLAKIYKLEKPNKIFELYWNFLDLQKYSDDISYIGEWSEIFSSLKGVNLLDNPCLKDLNNDGVPDSYVFTCVGAEATRPNKEVIRNKEYNTYHIWQKEGKGWFSTYFHIGRVLPNTFFTFSIDIKRVNTKGEVHAMLYTTRISNREWYSGNDYSEIGLVEDLRNGWKREFHTIKTNGYSDIILSGWIVAWGYGQADGHVYVRKPKVEIGNKATLWSY